MTNNQILQNSNIIYSNNQTEQFFNNLEIQNQNDPNNQIQQIINNLGFQNIFNINSNNQLEQISNYHGIENQYRSNLLYEFNITMFMSYKIF